MSGRASTPGPITAQDSSVVTRLSKLVANVLFPPRCVVCRARGAWLCSRCRPQLSLFQPPICLRCGLPAEGVSGCEMCRGQPLPVGALRVSGYFDGPLRQAVHRLKFSGERYLAEPLGEILAATWNHGPLPADALVTVPLHPKHEATRGYNQSLLLARAAGARLGLPVIEDGLRRVRETPPQMGLPREERLANVRGAFAWQSDYPCPPRLVLVDDVMTTGATLAACAAALRQAGASAVYALVLARVR